MLDVLLGVLVLLFDPQQELVHLVETPANVQKLVAEIEEGALGQAAVANIRPDGPIEDTGAIAPMLVLADDDGVAVFGAAADGDAVMVVGQRFLDDADFVTEREPQVKVPVAQNGEGAVEIADL